MGRRGGKFDGAALEDSVGVCPSLGFDIGVEACIQRSVEHADDLNSLKCVGPACPNYDMPKPKRKRQERSEPVLVPPPGMNAKDAFPTCIEPGCKNGTKEPGTRCLTCAPAKRGRDYQGKKLLANPGQLKEAARRLAEGFALLAEAIDE